MELALPLLQQLLSLAKEEDLVVLDRFFASEDGREVQLLGFLPPEEAGQQPQLLALTFDRRAWEEDWEVECPHPHRRAPATHRQQLIQEEQTLERPTLLDQVDSVAVGTHMVEVTGSSADSIGQEQLLLIARFVKAGLKADKLGGTFAHQYLHRLTLAPPWNELLPQLSHLACCTSEPVRLIAADTTQRVAAHKRMTLSVGMREREYRCVLPDREHRFWVEQVQLYDPWAQQRECIERWKERGRYTPRQLAQIQRELEEQLVNLCPPGRLLPMILYESWKDIQLDFYDREYLNSPPDVGNQSGTLAVAAGGQEVGPHGHRLRYCLLQTPVTPDTQQVKAELLFAWLPQRGREIAL